MSKEALLIRADASVSIGTGHIMRMIALGQAWQAQGREVHFLCAEITPALEQRLASEGFHLLRIHATLGSQEDLSETMRLISETLQADPQNARVVLNGFHFGSDYQLGIKAAGFKLLVVDDYGHADFYHADWVLNQNISAREELYAKRSPATKLLLGPKFAMLRKEFLAYKGWQREIAPVAKKILVTLGGSDPDNVTLKVIQALIDLDLHVKVVIGGSNSHLREIDNFIQSQNNSTALIEVIVNATNMPELMVWADVAVAAAGSTARPMNRSELVEKNHPELSVRKQCALLSVKRSVYYYKPMKQSEEERNLARALDKIYMIDPCMGSRRLVTKLSEGYGIGSNRKQVQRVRREMGIETIWCKPKRTSVPDNGHRKYPYLEPVRKAACFWSGSFY